MAVASLEVTDFRCFDRAVLEPDPRGLTVLRGGNGAGKTSLLEAVGWLATGRSFRAAPREALVRTGAARAVVRAEVDRAGRRVQVEAELPRDGSPRTLLNRQPVRRRAQLAEGVQVSVFSPDDLDLVQEGPGGRRDFVDEALVDRQPRAEALVGEVERILRQRTALLRQAGGRLGAEVAATLDVWDTRLGDAGTRLVEAREALLGALEPLVEAAYRRLARTDDPVNLTYRRSWSGSLADALERERADDLRRQQTGSGPHRDEVDLAVAGRPARTQASQGEQRSLALGLRLAVHQLRAAELPEPPVLLLDDVFSELDPTRAAALVEQLPAGQVLLTTAVDPPAAVTPDRIVDVAGGRVSAGVTR